jgi:hypothetical protein
MAGLIQLQHQQPFPMINSTLNKSANQHINDLIRQCQDLHDVAYDLHPKRDADRIEQLDEVIGQMQRQILALRHGQAIGYRLKRMD